MNSDQFERVRRAWADYQAQAPQLEATRQRIEQTVAVIRFLSPECADDLAAEYADACGVKYLRHHGGYWPPSALAFEITLEAAEYYRDALLAGECVDYALAAQE